MAGKTKGKERKTLELDPDVCRLLEEVKERTGRSFGSTVEELVRLALDNTPEFYEELFEFSQNRVCELTDTAIRERDRIKRQRIEALREEYLKLGYFIKPHRQGSFDVQYFTAIIPLKEDILDPEEIINPEDQSGESILYLVWIFESKHPQDQFEAIQKRSLGALRFGFFSHCPDLHKYDIERETPKTKGEPRAGVREIEKLYSFMKPQAQKMLAEDPSLDALQFAWTNIENASRDTYKIGVSQEITRDNPMGRREVKP